MFGRNAWADMIGKLGDVTEFAKLDLYYSHIYMASAAERKSIAEQKKICVEAFAKSAEPAAAKEAEPGAAKEAVIAPVFKKAAGAKAGGVAKAKAKAVPVAEASSAASASSGPAA